MISRMSVGESCSQRTSILAPVSLENLEDAIRHALGTGKLTPTNTA